MREEQRKRARSLLGISGFTELAAVIEGVKPGIRSCATGKKAAEISDLASELNLCFEESTYGVEDGIATGGIVHTLRRLPRRPEKEDRRFIYIGVDNLAIHFMKTFDTRDHRRVGFSLGYPK
jgi:hypothetical protein